VRKPPPSRLNHFGVRFLRAQRGATAVEFALVSVPLLMLVVGVVELAMVFLVSTSLETAMERASRKIRTGEFQVSAANTQGDFKTLVCSGMSWLSSKCTNDLWLDVSTYSNFDGLAKAKDKDPATFDPTKVGALCWSPGQPTDIVLVRAYFQWKLFTPLLSRMTANMGGGRRLLTATTAFRNEPFNNNPPVGNSNCP
jgi:Flp pilus assembly protein TadG